MDDTKEAERKAIEKLGQVAEALPPALDAIAAHMAITRALADIVRERLGISAAELRERAKDIAATRGSDVGVMGIIAAVLPDEDVAASEHGSTLLPN